MSSINRGKRYKRLRDHFSGTKFCFPWKWQIKFIPIIPEILLIFCTNKYKTLNLWIRSVQVWVIERLDRILADAFGSNIVEKCDVKLSRAVQLLTSDGLRVLLFIAHFISLSSTIQIAHVEVKDEEDFLLKKTVRWYKTGRGKRQSKWLWLPKALQYLNFCLLFLTSHRIIHFSWYPSFPCHFKRVVLFMILLKDNVSY